MTQAKQMSRVESNIYTFIGDAGAVTAGELVDFLGVEEFRAQAWLREPGDAAAICTGTRPDGTGHACPWPRIGF